MTAAAAYVEPCQVLSPAHNALQDELEAREFNLPDFLGLISAMVQMIDGHVTIGRSNIDAQIILDLRAADSNFAPIVWDNAAILYAFASRITRAPRSDLPAWAVQTLGGICGPSQVRRYAAARSDRQPGGFA